MNNYHLYEEIGHGKYSMVYKGRKRHTIRYVAVKSIEKSRRDKVMTEVNVLSQLRHPNVVGFVNWYETRNHLWIIFEYCAGGDVLRLLKQDGRLPEDTVRRFGRDVCAGLLHVHSRGVVYSDLKPANVLFCEDSTLKLCDFGHSQRLEDIARAIQEGAQLPRRGTPHYMAPELFQEGGMHSFASDLWALGCVLHEMQVGKPPFHSSSFTQLQQMVLKDPPPLNGNGSAELQALLAALLCKPPFDRAGWPHLRQHAFWQGRPIGKDDDGRALPEEPHVEELRRAWQQHASGMRPSSRDQEVAPTETPVPAAALPSRQAAQVRARGVESEIVEPEAEQDPRSGAAPTPASTQIALPAPGGPSAPPAPSPAQATVPKAQPVSTMQPHGMVRVPSQGQVGAIGTTQPTSLRARLGASTYARVREIMNVTETGVRPISRNPQIEELESLDAPLDLPFVPLRLEEVCSRPHGELEAFLSKVYESIAQGPLEQKLDSLKYLEQICCHMQVADIVVNSALLRLVLRMLAAKKAADGNAVPAKAPLTSAAVPPLRARLLSLVGQLLRHATYLEPTIADLGLVDILLEGLNEFDTVTVRRRSAAALGELLFYIATQPRAEDASPAGQSPGGAGAGGGSWQVSKSVLQGLTQVLRVGSGDEVVRHYVAKTVENVATQCPAIGQRWFFAPELVRALAHHARQSSYDPFRLSCLAAAAHLLRGRIEADASLDLALLEPDLVVLGLTDLAPQGVLYGIQLLASAFVVAPSADGSVPVAALPLPEQPVELFVSIVGQPRYPGGLRGRACVLLTMLFALDDVREARHLRAAIDCSFLPHVDRLGREKDPFVVQCVAAAAAVMDSVIVAILQSLVDRLRQLSAAQPNDKPAQAIATSIVLVLPVFLHLLSSASLASSIFSSRALPLLSAVCELAARPSPAAAGQHQAYGGGLTSSSSALHQLQPLVLMVMEALGSQQALLLEHAPQVVRCVLPALAACLPSGRSDVRLLALKAFTAVSVTLLNDGHVFEPTAAQPTDTTVLLETLLCGRALPELPTLLGDEAPAPSCALRLLAALLSRGSAAAGTAVRDLGLAQPLLAALRGQQALSLHTALLVQCLLRGHAVRARDLREAGVLAAVTVALSEAAEAASSGHAAQMDLAMVDAALCVAEELLSQALPSSQHPHPQHKQLLAELTPLPQALPKLMALCAPLAHARLVPLLDRASACCQYLADLLSAHQGRQLAAELPARSVTSLLDALAAIARWRRGPVPGAAAELTGAVTLQRRMLEVLAWAVSACPSPELQSEARIGLERLLRDRLLDDNPDVAAEVQALLAATARGSGAASGHHSGPAVAGVGVRRA